MFINSAKTDLKSGLKAEEIESRRVIWGSNEKKNYFHSCNNT